MKSKSWIFVSHASADLAAVREVRNYLESKDASPLLFHLLALKHEDEFWPLIEREIAEREFFLLCESDAADQSEWVRRERAAVRSAAMYRPKRIGTIRVDSGPLDMTRLDRLLGTMRVFPSFRSGDLDQAQRFLSVLAGRGFEVFRERTEELPGRFWHNEMRESFFSVAAYGFVLLFLSHGALRDAWVQSEISLALEHNVRLVPIKIDSELDDRDFPPELRHLQHFDATREPETAPNRLADFLHEQAL